MSEVGQRLPEAALDLATLVETEFLGEVSLKKAAMVAMFVAMAFGLGWPWRCDG